MVYIQKPIVITPNNFNFNDDLPENPKFDGDFTFTVADSVDEDSVVDIKIGDDVIGWLTKDSALELAKAIIDVVSPLIKKEDEQSE